MASAKTQDNTGLAKILLDAEVVGKDGNKVTLESLQKFDVVGFYFSAHWCPPCRRFTPMLAKAYGNLRKEKQDKFEIVFCSSDRSESEANEYYKESHPWLRMTWKSNSTHKSRLSSQLEAGGGIPALVLVDPKTGETITRKGTEGFWGNESGKGFPFKPRSFAEIMADGPAFSQKGGKKLTYDDLTKNYDYTIMYFSAHWCPPCRKFTPEFIKWYTNNQAKMAAGKTFEVIFFSSDKDADQFAEYYKEMPWATAEFEDKRTDELKRLYEVSGIPSVQVINNKTGKVAEPNGCGGRSGVTNDPNAEKFPWPKEAAGNLMMALDSINETPVVLVLGGKKSDKIMQALTTVGSAFLKDGKMEIEFALEDGSTPGQLLNRVKGLFKMKDEETLVVTDLGNGAFHKPKEIVKLDDIDEKVIQQLVDDFKAGKLDKTSL